MLAFLLAPFYLLVNYYVLRWILRWMGACTKYFKSKYFMSAFITLYILISTTPLTSFIIGKGALHRFLKQVNNYWLGIFLYIIFFIFIMDVARFILKHIHFSGCASLSSRKVFVTAGAITAVLIITTSVYGILNARQMYVTSYDLSVDKSCEAGDSLKIVLVADLHLGYSVGEWKTKQMVNKINSLDADLVCIAGDIFDNDYDAVKEPDKIRDLLKTIKSTYGVYACYGNHDLNEKILAGFTFKSDDPSQKNDPRMAKMLTDAGITLLNDEAILIDNAFYVMGRDDASRSKKLGESRMSPKELLDGLDQSKPVIVIDHQPKELQELADAGADVVLGGHTHDGQMFPGNLMVDLMWENSCGYIKKDGMHSIVTSGVGIWGPNMRVGTKSEIVEVILSFESYSFVPNPT